jgi:hypothetical protein
MKSLCGHRRITVAVLGLATVIILAALKAPSDAYLAVAALVSTYFGAAGVEQWRAKSVSPVVNKDGE